MDPNWVTFVERSVGAWMHVEHILGLYVFAANERSCPTNMHNTVLAVNSAHKIRFAQDLALYNLTLSEEIESFDGAAHVDAWNNDTEMQGVRELTEALTAVEDDWGEAMFATNVMFEPLIGELFRSGLVMHAAPGNGDFVTPTVMGAGESDYAQRDLAWTKACFGPLVHDREFADHNKQLMQGWLSAWVPRALTAARTMQPLWSQPDHRPPRFEDSLDRVKNRFAGIVTDLGLDVPEGAGPVTTTAAPVFGAVNATSSGTCGITLMNDQVGEVIADVMKEKAGVTVTYLPSMIRLDAVERMDFLYDELSEALGDEPGSSARPCSRRACRRTTAGWSTRTTGRSCSPIRRTRPSTSASTSPHRSPPTSPRPRKPSD